MIHTYNYQFYDYNYYLYRNVSDLMVRLTDVEKIRLKDFALNSSSHHGGDNKSLSPQNMRNWIRDYLTPVFFYERWHPADNLAPHRYAIWASNINHHETLQCLLPTDKLLIFLIVTDSNSLVRHGLFPKFFSHTSWNFITLKKYFLKTTECIEAFQNNKSSLQTTL